MMFEENIKKASSINIGDVILTDTGDHQQKQLVVVAYDDFLLVSVTTSVVLAVYETREDLIDDLDKGYIKLIDYYKNNNLKVIRLIDRDNMKIIEI